MWNIDKITIILLSGLFLIILFKPSSRYASEISDVDAKEFFLKKSLSIRTNNPNDTNFSDLNFLSAELEGKKIVLIGEQQHGDGATYLMKIRLLDYLHRKLGYNIIITESNIYDTYLLNRDIKKYGSEADLGIAYYAFWSQTRESQQFKSFLVRNKLSLNLYGFDIQPSGTREDFRYHNIYNYIKKNDSTLIGKYDKLFSVLPYISLYQHSSYSDKLSDGDKRKILTQADSLVKKITMFEPDEEKYRIAGFFSGLKWWLYNAWHNNENRQAAFRDSMMAQNCISLIDSVIDNQKIVILSANSHVMYNEGFSNNNYKRFGSFLKSKYNNDLYCILTTSYDGYTGMLYKNDSIRINQSGKSSAERLIHKLNQEFLYYSFKNADKIRDKNYSLKCLGHNNHIACWAKMCDGLIYIDHLTPIHYD